MALSLSADVIDREQESTLTVLEACKHNGKHLAACETSSGAMVLARQRTRPVKDRDGKRPKQDSSGKARATEPYWKASPSVADFRDAVAGGLFIL